MEFNIDFRERADARFYAEEHEELHDLDVLAAAFTVPQHELPQTDLPPAQHAGTAAVGGETAQEPPSTFPLPQKVTLVEKPAAILTEPNMRRYKRSRGAALQQTLPVAHAPNSTPQTGIDLNAASGAIHTRVPVPPPVVRHEAPPSPDAPQSLVRLDRMFAGILPSTQSTQPGPMHRKITARTRGRVSRPPFRKNAAFEQLKASSGLPTTAPARGVTRHQSEPQQAQSLSDFFSQAAVAHHSRDSVLPRVVAAANNAAMQSEAPSETALLTGATTPRAAGTAVQTAMSLATMSGRAAQGADGPKPPGGVSLANLFSQFEAQGA